MENLNAIEKITLIISITIVLLINLSLIVDKANIKETIKRFKKLSLIITLLMSSSFIKSQDTIYLKDKTIICAKIIEVGISEIKYLHVDNLNGPNYVSSKNDISLIKYSNGVTDTIKCTPIVTDISNKIAPFYLSQDALIHSGNKIIYHNKRINDKKLGQMINEQAPSEKQVRLRREFKKLNEYKIKEGALAPGLFIAGTIVHGYALSQLFGSISNSSDASNGISALIVGAALRISGHVVNAVYKNKKKSKREEIVNIYNGIE